MFLEWLEQSWWMLGIIAGMFTYITAITTGGGRFGRWARSKIVGQIEMDMKAFMDEHKGCKPQTEKSIAELKRKVSAIEIRLDNEEKLRKRDWESWKLQFRIDDNLLEHVKHGNHFDECSECKDELHQHLLNNR